MRVVGLQSRLTILVLGTLINTDRLTETYTYTHLFPQVKAISGNQKLNRSRHPTNPGTLGVSKVFCKYQYFGTKMALVEVIYLQGKKGTYSPQYN